MRLSTVKSSEIISGAMQHSDSKFNVVLKELSSHLTIIRKRLPIVQVVSI